MRTVSGFQFGLLALIIAGAALIQFYRDDITGFSRLVVAASVAASISGYLLRRRINH